MTKTQRFWLRAARLLSDPGFFDSERERVLAEHPLLNSHGLGLSGYNPIDLDAAREELRAGGRYEAGIRNTLEYFAETRVSLSYRLRGCGWARHFDGPAPQKRSSYGLKHQVESYFRARDRRLEGDGGMPQTKRYTSNGAFICAALMAGLQMWPYRDSINPYFRLGRPWAVAGMQPEDFSHPDDERMARFWRWAVQHEVSGTHVEDFIADTVDLLYSGADLKQLRDTVGRSCFEARDVYDRLRREFALNCRTNPGHPGWDSWPDKSRSRTTSTAWAVPRSRSCSGRRRDVPAGYPRLAVGGGGTRTLDARDSGPFARSGHRADVQHGEHLGGRDQERARQKRLSR